MMKEKVVKTMKVLYWVFFLVILSTIAIEGPLGWWILGISTVGTLASSVIEKIYQQKIDKENSKRMEDILQEIRNNKF